jgi:hypothetical protein
MMVDDVKFVQQRNMRSRNVGDEKVPVVWQKRIGPRLRARSALARFARKARNFAHDERHASILERFRDGSDWTEGSAFQRVCGLPHDRRPQRVRRQQDNGHNEGMNAVACNADIVAQMANLQFISSGQGTPIPE